MQAKIKAVFLSGFLILAMLLTYAQNRPNVILIYADDLGYGDLSCYGATQIATPNLDRLAQQGIRFTNAHSTSATCTPSRYALMTGTYPWRKKGTGILPGDAALIIPTDRQNLATVFRNAGYATAVVGKWHLGLGNKREKNWNEAISPGPNELGFNYSFIFPATADRVPTVFLENGRVLGLDPADPIAVDYRNKIGNDPTGKENPELLKMKASPNHGHDNTIVNGIGRIGFMSGGHKARWTDEELSFSFLLKAQEFIETQKNDPFFLFFALTEPHVPRMPATIFKGKSRLGYRGDVILQLDWTVGEIMKHLERLGIANNTMIVFTSDNGPVVDDGYQDGAVTQLNGHTPAGPLRGGKYSNFEGGTRVPWIVSWPRRIKPGTSDALVCQVDLIASFASLLKQPLPAGDAGDSENMLNALMGKSKKGRDVLVTQGMSLAIIEDNFKYIVPGNAPAYHRLTNTELGNSKEPQLYDLNKDPGEQENLAATLPEKVAHLQALLKELQSQDKNLPDKAVK